MARRAQLRIATALVLASSSAAVDWQGGAGMVCVSGTFGGTVAALEIKGPDDAFYPINGCAFTANGIANFSAPAGPLRIFADGGDGTTAIDAWVIGIPSNI